jgi:type IV secretion system protein VirD4
VSGTPTAHLPSNDWTALDPVPAPPLAPETAPPPPQADAPQAPDDGDTNQATTETATDNANGGIRQDPALERNEDIAPQAKAPEGEFDFDAPHPDEEASQLRRAADRAMSGNARRAALDPDDGIEL